jgi:hypothetical protein
MIKNVAHMEAQRKYFFGIGAAAALYVIAYLAIETWTDLWASYKLGVFVGLAHINNAITSPLFIVTHQMKERLGYRRREADGSFTDVTWIDARTFRRKVTHYVLGESVMFALMVGTVLCVSFTFLSLTFFP